MQISMQRYALLITRLLDWPSTHEWVLNKNKIKWQKIYPAISAQRPALACNKRDRNDQEH